MVKKLTIN